MRETPRISMHNTVMMIMKDLDARNTKDKHAALVFYKSEVKRIERELADENAGSNS